MYKDGKYTPLSLEEAVDIAANLLMIFECYNIHVIRVGLQPTENIRLGRDVVAGLSSVFRQLVESYIYRMVLEEY